MPWTYTVNRKLNIVEVIYAGNTSAQDLQESTSQFISMEKEQRVNRFLIDTSKMELTASLTDLYNLPDKQYIEEQAQRSGRVALVLATTAREKEAVKFYETACQNRGWNVKAFMQRRAALEWLTGSSSANKPNPDNGL